MCRHNQRKRNTLSPVVLEMFTATGGKCDGLFKETDGERNKQ